MHAPTERPRGRREGRRSRPIDDAPPERHPSRRGARRADPDGSLRTPQRRPRRLGRRGARPRRPRRRRARRRGERRSRARTRSRARRRRRLRRRRRRKGKGKETNPRVRERRKRRKSHDARRTRRGRAWMEGGRSARARGFREGSVGGEVRSRSVDRATRRDARYDEAPPSRPVDRPDRARAIERRRSRESEGSRTEKRERRRFSRIRRARVMASRTRASGPVFAAPDAPARCGSLLRGLLLHRGPALVDHPSRLDRARGRREKKVSTRAPIARRARGNGDDDAFAFAREPSRFDAPASTGVRLPSAGTFTNAHTERGGTCERLCVWAAPTLVLLCVIGTFHSGLFVAMSSERLVLVFGKFITQADTLIFLRDDLQPRRVIFWRAAEKINASHSRLQTPLARLQTLL